jgi:hypothetical protein
MKLKLLSLCLAVSGFCLPGLSQGTAFTYQGRLNDGTNPANGSYDFQFYLRDDGSGGNPVGITNNVGGVDVTNGLFTVTLDFGNQFSGADRWLEIGVRTNGVASFVTLSPRQKLTPTPYAIFASTAGGAISNFNVGGALNLPATAATIYSGGNSLLHSDSYEENFFAGQSAGNWPLTTGQANTAVGINALLNDATGGDNSAFGDSALSANTSGYANTAIGSAAMSSNTNGIDNTAIGVFALGGYSSGSSGSYNTAEGVEALTSLTTGNNNTANGFGALIFNTSGGFNVADGYLALYANLNGDYNTAVGESALYNNTGSYNVAVGDTALYLKTSGNDNIAIGDGAGYFLTTGSWNIDIGNPGTASDDHTIKIGQQGAQTTTVIAGIYGTSISGGNHVYVNSSGQIGSVNPVFVHTATSENTIEITGSRYGDATMIDNALCNGKPNAILIVTPSDNGAGFDPDGHPFFVEYANFGNGNHWYIQANGGSISAGQQFNVLVANP